MTEASKDKEDTSKPSTSSRGSGDQTKPPFDSDEKQEEETRRLANRVHEDVVKLKESEAVDILRLLDEISQALRKYKVEKDQPSLDRAASKAREAVTLMNERNPLHVRGMGPLSKFDLSSLVWVTVTFSAFYGFLHFISSLRWSWPPFSIAIWDGNFFVLDLFFIAVFGALASAIVKSGISRSPKETRIYTSRALSILAASPFVAVVLVVLFTELTIGVGGELSTTGLDVGIFTLKDASLELRLAFAFVFGFFGEVSLDLLRRIIAR